MKINNLKRAFLAAFILFWLQVANASALTIITRSIGGTAPPNAAGGGNLEDIVNTAARIWESAYSDSIVLILYYGWAPVGDAGTHTLQEMDAQGREVAGVLLFDNSGTVQFYLDPTPDLNEEYGRRTDDYQDFGGGRINAARFFSNPMGNAAGRLDLLSVALHEIGHSLGFSSANPGFARQCAQGLLYITGDYPYAGSAIPIAYNYYGIVPHFDAGETVYGSLMSGVNADERRMPSELDILANAQMSGFTIAALDPEHAYPERTMARGPADAMENREGSNRNREGFRAFTSESVQSSGSLITR